MRHQSHKASLCLSSNNAAHAAHGNTSCAVSAPQANDAPQQNSGTIGAATPRAQVWSVPDFAAEPLLAESATCTLLMWWMRCRLVPADLRM